MDAHGLTPLAFCRPCPTPATGKIRTKARKPHPSTPKGHLIPCTAGPGPTMCFDRWWCRHVALVYANHLILYGQFASGLPFRPSLLARFFILRSRRISSLRFWYQNAKRLNRITASITKFCTKDGSLALFASAFLRHRSASSGVSFGHVPPSPPLIGHPSFVPPSLASYASQQPLAGAGRSLVVSPAWRGARRPLGTRERGRGV